MNKYDPMKAWRRALITVGIALEIISISGFIYMTTIIPEIDLKAIMFYSAPIAGMLYGIVVLTIAARLKVKV